MVDEIVLCNQFAVSSVDHELTHISFAGPPPDGLLDIEKDLPRISSTEIERIAQEWAQKWLSSEEYSFYLSSYTSPRWGYSGRYLYCFCRKVGDIETTDHVKIHVSDRGNLVAISTGGVGWTKRHQKELDAFSAEDAIEAAKEASGLSSPTVKEAEFGITPDDRVFLRVYLVGANDEAPVVLAVTQE